MNRLFIGVVRKLQFQNNFHLKNAIFRAFARKIAGLVRQPTWLLNKSKEFRMKKILAIFLGCIVATGAFAEFRFRFYQDFNGYLFSAIMPTGLYAQEIVPDQYGDPEFNTGVSSTVLDRGFLFPVSAAGRTGYFVPGSYSFFTTAVAPDASVLPDGVSWVDFNTNRLYVNFTRNRFEAYLSFNGSALMASLLNRSSPSANDLLSFFRIDEYWFRANHDMFLLWFGDRTFPTKVAYYPDLTDFSPRMKLDNFGVLVPGGNWVYRPITNMLFSEIASPPNVTDLRYSGYFVGSIKLLNYFLQIPITVDLGMDIGQAIQSQINAGATNPGQTRMSGGVAVRGERIADLFNFDLTYKIRGGDPTRDNTWDEDLNPGGSVQPDGAGVVSHVLGLAVGLPSLIPSMNISLSYTGLFATYEDKAPRPDTLDPYVTQTGPFFSGIDLSLRYTGISDLRLTLNNNISFASAKEPVYNDDNILVGISVPVTGAGTLPQYQSQKWLAIYNALAARYTVSSLMNAHLDIAHRMSVLTVNNSDDGRGSSQLTGWGESVKIKSMLQVSAFTSLSLFSGVTLQVGVSMFLENNKTQFSDYPDGAPSDHVTASWSGGGIGFGLPIRVIFNW